MRVDGYCILSDALDEPNLHDTWFRLTRWHLRTHALGLREPPPTHHVGSRRRLLVTNAYATWVCRLLLFPGIALIVYTMAFKLLGILPPGACRGGLVHSPSRGRGGAPSVGAS